MTAGSVTDSPTYTIPRLVTGALIIGVITLNATLTASTIGQLTLQQPDEYAAALAPASRAGSSQPLSLRGGSGGVANAILPAENRQAPGRMPADVARARLMPIGLAMLLNLMVLVAFVMQERAVERRYRLARTEARLRAILEATREGLVLFDESGKIVEANRNRAARHRRRSEPEPTRSRQALRSELRPGGADFILAVGRRGPGQHLRVGTGTSSGAR